MRNVWAVIRREYLQRVRSRWFVIATVAGPLLMLALLFVPAYLASRGEDAERTISIVDGTGVLYERLAPELEEGGWTVSRQRWHADVMSELRARAEEGDIGGFLMLDELTLETGEAIFYASSAPSTLRRLSMRSSIARVALEVRLEMAGVDAAPFLDGEGLRVELLSEDGSGPDEARFIMGYVGAFFLYMVLLIYAVSVMRATLEEKTSRVVEVVISAMKPWHLMLGKIVGVGAVGLTQMAVWFGAAFLVFAFGLPTVIAARPELAQLSEISEALPSLGLAVLFIGFFLGGYFMYSGMYAAVGAMCNTDEEAQQAQFPLVMLFIVPLMLVRNVLLEPNSTLSMWLSFFPPFTPILMWGRVAGGGVPGWQVTLSFVLMALALLAIAWIAGRIYKVGILMAGKRPTLPELLRWVREA